MKQENKWDRRYGEPGFAYGTNPNDFLRQSVHHLPPAGDVLCLAEGEGRNSVFLAKQGYKVIGVDSSRVGIEKCLTLAAEQGVKINAMVADLGRFEIKPESFDGIVSVFCHLPPPLRREVHRKVIAGLRPQGVFILEGYTPKQLEHGTGGPPIPELLMELKDLKEELADLKLIHAAEVEREVLEGRLHTGLASVVQIIGIKL